MERTQIYIYLHKQALALLIDSGFTGVSLCMENMDSKPQKALKFNCDCHLFFFFAVMKVQELHFSSTS